MKDGGSAFPEVMTGPHANVHSTGGMTLRDYLAAKAMAMLLLEELDACSGKLKQWDADIVAQGAYVMADAMIDERGSK